MKINGFGFDASRELLSQVILSSLNSWPELQRRVFIENHYHGRPVEEISREVGIGPREVIRILEQCERKLFHALKAFRDGTPSEVSEEPPHPVVFALRACCH